MGGVYYNEIDGNAAAWLRELIRDGQIPDGEVDTRSITAVAAEDLAGYHQCHFFAGIGGWAYALRLAGWPDDRAVWTGSCPCQPFSSAGAQKGISDPRHLWPVWFRLIAQCRPPVIFGEQVEAAIAHGWLDLVQANVEGEGYAFGAAGLPAASVGAPHIRGRVWFVGELGDADRPRTIIHGAAGAPREAVGERGGAGERLAHTGGERPPRLHPLLRQGGGREGGAGQASEAAGGGELGELADSQRSGPTQGRRPLSGAVGARNGSAYAGQLGHSPLGGLGIDRRAPGHPGHPDQPEQANRVDNATTPRRQYTGQRPETEARDETRLRGLEHGRSTSGLALPDQPLPSNGGLQRSGAVVQPREDAPVGFWSLCSWLPCIDGKSRPVEPGTFPLAHGVPARVGRLRGYGNAIVPQVAAQFIQAYLAC